MRFGNIHMLGVLWLVPLTVFFYMWANKDRLKAMEKFAEKNLFAEIGKNINAGKKRIKVIFIVMAVFFISLAILRPQWGFTAREVKRQGIDILIALDTSNSMLAEDILPDRLERSKLAIKDFVRELKGDRVGLIAFSGTAFLQCPLTLDYNGFLLSLNDIAIDTIPVGGTSITSAINKSIESYEGGAKKHKILIIITDGEDLEGGVESAVARAKSKGITVYTVGIGTETGELIPIRTEAGKMEFLKDETGSVVKTRLNEKVLEKIALSTGGIYVKATGLEFGLNIIYKERLSKIEKEDFKSRVEKQYNEKFQIPLGIAFLLLFAELFISDKASVK